MAAANLLAFVFVVAANRTPYFRAVTASLASVRWPVSLQIAIGKPGGRHIVNRQQELTRLRYH